MELQEIFMSGRKIRQLFWLVLVDMSVKLHDIEMSFIKPNLSAFFNILNEKFQMLIWTWKNNVNKS